MDSFEILNQEAKENGIHVIPYSFKSERIKGLYCDRTIAINDSINTTAEKACILAEELGHYHTSSGNIISQSTIENRKQEHRARLWAYNRQITLTKLIDAYKHGCQSLYEIAEYLGVTIAFLNEAIDCYRQKYGVSITVNGYNIIFIPNLMVGKINNKEEVFYEK